MATITVKYTDQEKEFSGGTMIKNYDDFYKELLRAGFSMAGGNSEGIFAVVNFSWNDEPGNSPLRWHTGDPKTDPWEWRMRVLEEESDIAYGKIFLRKGGFLTRKWYPYFLAARRQGRDFEEEYREGLISHEGKRIYEAIVKEKELPLEEIKRVAGFGKEDKSRFDRGLVELQMKMYLTMSGRRQRRNLQGEISNCWHSTVFCTTESFFGEEVFKEAGRIVKEEAVEAIAEQILMLNPEAAHKKIRKFIEG
jgi:hypothetical protein